jgi:hypothetical protein
MWKDGEKYEVLKTRLSESEESDHMLTKWDLKKLKLSE